MKIFLKSKFLNKNLKIKIVSKIRLITVKKTVIDLDSPAIMKKLLSVRSLWVMLSKNTKINMYEAIRFKNEDQYSLRDGSWSVFNKYSRATAKITTSPVSRVMAESEAKTRASSHFFLLA